MSVKPKTAPPIGQIPPRDLFRWSNKDLEKTWDSWKKKNDGKPEVKNTVQACSDPNECVVVRSGYKDNGLLGAVHVAFSHHIPLKLDPDDIWLTFLSQVSLLINNDPEKYRMSFVNHQGKEIIRVRHDGLVLNEEINAGSQKWKFVFPEFEKALNSKMKIEMNVAFSTTTLTRYIASEILVMASMKNYFDYRVMTCCGIPEIRIGGTVEDWTLLKNKINEICPLIFCSDWIPKFGSFIDESIKVIQGKGDPEYWDQIYYWDAAHGSGGVDKTTGLINELFPLTDEGKPGKGLKEKRPTDSFPSVVGEVPFIWEYYGTNINCEFKSGLTHVSFDEKKYEVSPRATWQIRTNYS
jgi:hypothetical protein